MTDVAGNPEEERRAEFYHQPWSQEAVSRYFYCKVWDPRPGASSSLSPPEKPPTLSLATWSFPCSQMLLQVGGAHPVAHQQLVTCTWSFLYRSSSAGRSWSNRWSYATPRRAGDASCWGPLGPAPAHPLGPGHHPRRLVGEAGAGLKVIYLITAVWSLATGAGGGGLEGGEGSGSLWEAPHPLPESPHSHFS